MHLATTQSKVGSPESLPPAVDVAVLDALIAEIGDGMPELRSALLADYLADAPKQISTLATAATEGVASTAAAAAHQLRSGSALLGATRLAGMLTTVELAAGQPEPDLAGLVPPAVAEFERVRSELAGLLEPSSPGPDAAA